MFRLNLTPSARTGAPPPGDWLDNKVPNMRFGIRLRYSTNVDGLVHDYMIVRRRQLLVCQAACRLELRYSWLACEKRVAFRPSYQVTVFIPLGLSWEEGQEFFGRVICRT